MCRGGTRRPSCRRWEHGHKDDIFKSALAPNQALTLDLALNHALTLTLDLNHDINPTLTLHKAVSNLGSVELFGSKLQLDISRSVVQTLHMQTLHMHTCTCTCTCRKHCKITNAPLEFELSDGTSSVKDYFMGQSR